MLATDSPLFLAQQGRNQAKKALKACNAHRAVSAVSALNSIVAVALILAPAAQADRHPDPPPHVEAAADAQGSWHPDGMVCVPGQGCRYVAPGCELVRVMDDQGELSGTRWVLFCRSPRGAV